MVERIAQGCEGEDPAGGFEIQSFPNGQLGSGKDMMESVSAGALHLTTDGAGALGAFLPQVSAWLRRPTSGAMLRIWRRFRPRRIFSRK